MQKYLSMLNLLKQFKIKLIIINDDNGTKKTLDLQGNKRPINLFSKKNCSTVRPIDKIKTVIMGTYKVLKLRIKYKDAIINSKL